MHGNSKPTSLSTATAAEADLQPTVDSADEVVQASSLSTESLKATAPTPSDDPTLPILSSSSHWVSLLQSELSVVSGCLQHNPKSYGAWHHRVWIMQNITDEQHSTSEQTEKAWQTELQLCNLFLTKDERNCK